MNRNEKILHLIDREGRGIEIGPSYNPVAPKKEGYRVEVIDHLSREELIAKHEKPLASYVGVRHATSPDNIEEVDYVWSGQPYKELTGKSKFYDWIIASHVIEHTPNLVGFLNDCDSIMQDGGVLSLAVPDKRFCFDHFRPVTGISKIIDAHYRKNTLQSPGTAAEHFLNLVTKGEAEIIWSAGEQIDYRFAGSLEKAREAMASVIDRQEYVDVHGYCFTPHSFRMIIEDLYLLGLSPFREMCFFPTDTFEFFVTLGRAGKGHGLGRLEMLQQIEQEQNYEEIARVEDTRLQLQDMRAERDEALQEIRRIHASDSWRFTAPMRKVMPAVAACVSRLKKMRQPSS